jgi:citrate lyase subunit beta/citryl-CoA lyase
VPPDRKAKARAEVQQWLERLPPDGTHDRSTIAVRINDTDTLWHAADLSLCALGTVNALVLPKAESGEELRVIAAALPALVLLPLVESAVGIARLNEIAAASNVQRLIFGTIDFQADLDIERDGEELLFYRSQFVLASRLANLQAPVDGVSTSIDDDADRVEVETRHARRLGFGGKLCIHPRQVLRIETVPPST